MNLQFTQQLLNPVVIYTVLDVHVTPSIDNLILDPLSVSKGINWTVSATVVDPTGSYTPPRITINVAINTTLEDAIRQANVLLRNGYFQACIPTAVTIKKEKSSS